MRTRINLEVVYAVFHRTQCFSTFYSGLKFNYFLKVLKLVGNFFLQIGLLVKQPTLPLLVVRQSCGFLGEKGVNEFLYFFFMVNIESQ